MVGIIYSGAIITPNQTADTPVVNYSTIENNLETIILLQEETLGYYDDQTHTIAININFLQKGNSTDILETLTHEAFHAYEHRLVDLYTNAADELKDLRLLHRAKIYIEEFENYIDGSDDPIGYFFQAVEFDSDAYAASAADRYFDAIYVYQDDT